MREGSPKRPPFFEAFLKGKLGNIRIWLNQEWERIIQRKEEYLLKCGKKGFGIILV